MELPEKITITGIGTCYPRIPELSSLTVDAEVAMLHEIVRRWNAFEGLNETLKAMMDTASFDAACGVHRVQFGPVMLASIRSALEAAKEDKR